MDDKDLQLYQEETLLILKQTLQAVKVFEDLVKGQMNIDIAELNVKQPDEMKVKGKVEVSNLEPTDLSPIQAGLDSLSDKLQEAIKKHSHKPLEAITVKNIKDAVPQSIKIDNLSELDAKLLQIVTAIQNNQPVITVEKNEIKFPQGAKNPIPVRLSDGKSYYNAVFNASLAASNEVDPTVGYQPADIDDASDPKYYGFVRKTGHWYILKEENNTYRYVVGAPTHDGGPTYPDAWTNRANLTYKYFYEVW